MRLTLLCALLSAVVLGCQPQATTPTSTPPASAPPAPTGLRFTPPTQEVTNGVYVIFSTRPSAAVLTALVDAGAKIKNTNGTVFVFDAVNSDARRNAVTSALLNGAELKGH